ncbi:MAG: cytochrome c [Xanthobacteraceae bacterium]
MRSRTVRKTIVALIAAAIVVVIAGAIFWRVFNPGPMAFTRGTTVALSDYHGADPTGVPTDFKNADVVKRGEYLARAADCMVCHTSQGGEQYAGGLAIPLPFGTLYSTNITPDKATGIGDYSDADFLNAVQRGVRRDGTHLYPAMPYPSYTYMTDADALAIKAYLFSLASVRSANRADTLGFPFNQRWLMGPWSFIFNQDVRFRPDAAQSPEWNRGAYVAEALAHCGECHTPRNLAFALNNRTKFAGALTAGWHAFNITSDRGSGIGAWNDEEIAAYLSTGHASGRGTAAGPMGEAVDQSFSLLAPADINAMVAYLRSVPPVASSEPATIAPPAPLSPKQGRETSDILGRKVFEGACVSCHSWTGVSTISPYATIAGARAVNDPTATNVAQIVISGTMRHAPKGIISMPGFGGIYSDEEIAAVVNYVTKRFGSEESKISAKDVAELRSSTSY